VGRASQRGIVRDAEGNFGSLPTTDNPWAEPGPISPAEETVVGPVPEHWKDRLGLPL
jgi:hypothetical protein